MSITEKYRAASRIFPLLTFTHLVGTVLSVLRETFGLPIRETPKSKWYGGIFSEVEYWDDWFRTKGLQCGDRYGPRLDPRLPLQKHVSDLLPETADVHILDVGAGPLTYLGKTCDKKRVYITAVDPLADEYDRMLKRHHVEPLVRTEKLDAEKLTARFARDTFDLVFARNCIDHSYDPERAILEMIEVVRTNCYVLLEHIPDEAEREAYEGLHQWNFSLNPSGEFVIRSKHSEINMTGRYSKLCSIGCEIDKSEDGAWLITRMRKIRSSDVAIESQQTVGNPEFWGQRHRHELLQRGRTFKGTAGHGPIHDRRRNAGQPRTKNLVLQNLEHTT